MKNKTFISDSFRFLIAILLLATTFLAGCQQNDPDPQTPGTGTTGPGSSTTTPGSSTTATTPGSSTTATTPVVVSAKEYINGAGNLTLLAAAVQRAGLGDNINQGKLTIFAPSDDAFRAAGYADVAAINAAPAANLQRILQYHVIASTLDASAFPTAVNSMYQTLLPEAQVSVYKTQAGVITVDKAKVIQANIPVTNSVVHIIDQVLTPPSLNVVDLTKANTDLSLFTAAVNRAGIQATLTANTAKGITVFAPSNAAFKAAGYADTAAIQKADPKVLASLLTYHVLNYRAFSRTFQDGSDVVTAQGTSVHFNVSGDKVTITGKGNGSNVANITQADLVTTNGVVHIIDRVLLLQ